MTQEQEHGEDDICLYFSCAVNMLKDYLTHFVKSPQRLSIGRLDNYRLDFISHSDIWGGPIMTIVPTANAHIWGVIWKIKKKYILLLDDQNSVDLKKYYPMHCNIETPHMGTFKCRVYRQKVNPLPRGDNDVIPMERWTSRSYKKTMIEGAIESGLPEYYIEQLKKLKDNGDDGCVKMLSLLSRYANWKPCECIVPSRIPRKGLKLQVNMPGKYNSIADLIKRLRD